MAVLKSDKSLWNVFQKAVKQTWTPERFTAELRNTPWFRHHSDAYRAAKILQTSDPATWRARKADTSAAIADMAAARGIPKAELYLVVPEASDYHARALLAGATELSPMLPRNWGDIAGYSQDRDGYVLAFASLFS